MILQTGMRTDIPAFYAEWFANRIKDGYVLVRNPYNPVQVTKYRLDPTVVDLIGFCTKNPASRLDGATRTCVISFIDLYQKVRKMRFTRQNKKAGWMDK